MPKIWFYKTFWWYECILGVCGENEEPSKCATLCPDTCQGQNTSCNPARCAQGCQCVHGFVRHNGRCIRKEDCNKQEPRCPAGERWNNCGTSCPDTCESSLSVVFDCPNECRVGCECEPGLVRHSGQCISRDKCPPTEAENSTIHNETRETRGPCNQNEQWNDCGTACPETCEGKLEICTLQCVPGCECKSGFVRNRNQCIPKGVCPESSPNQSSQHCQIDEMHSDCAKECTCIEFQRTGNCREICAGLGANGAGMPCFCKDGFVRASATNRTCISKDTCNLLKNGKRTIYSIFALWWFFIMEIFKIGSYWPIF